MGDVVHLLVGVPQQAASDRDTQPGVVVRGGPAERLAEDATLGTTILVTVKGQTGVASSTVSSGLTGTVASSTATASLTLPTNQPSIISASATFDLVASLGHGPVYAEGQRVARIRVVAMLGGPAQVTYITASGREIAATSLQ